MRAAAATAARFRRHGLRGSARAIVVSLTELGPSGMSLLEVGGGIGEIQVEMLETGAASSAVNVDLSPNWETAARSLLSERGLTERVTRLLGDFVERADSLPIVDAVILHRVVCCYPDWKAMLAAAISRADRFVVVTFPRPRLWSRTMWAVANGFLRLRRLRFRAFMHPPEEMIGLLTSSGYLLVADNQGLLWRTVVAGRATATGRGESGSRSDSIEGGSQREEGPDGSGQFEGREQ